MIHHYAFLAALLSNDLQKQFARANALAGYKSKSLDDIAGVSTMARQT